MGYWGNRAKDGDSPLDYFGNFQDNGGSADSFIKRYIRVEEKSKYQTGMGFFALFGCATLMIEKGHKVNAKLLTELYEKAKDVDGGICSEDLNFYKAYINGVVLKKKRMKVLVEIDVEAFDEKDAKLVAAKRIGIGFGEPIRENDDVQVIVKIS